jgi:hypothetical protein
MLQALHVELELRAGGVDEQPELLVATTAGYRVAVGVQTAGIR